MSSCLERGDRRKECKGTRGHFEVMGMYTASVVVIVSQVCTQRIVLLNSSSLLHSVIPPIKLLKKEKGKRGKRKKEVGRHIIKELCEKS